MKITDPLQSPDRNVIIVIDGKAQGELSEFLEHVQNKVNYWFFGAGSPENVVSAPVGAIYSRLDGGANTTLYVKESGTGNTGWAAK